AVRSPGGGRPERGQPSLHRGVGQEGDVTGPLDRERERTLLLGGEPGDPTRHDLTALGDEMLELLRVLVLELEVRLGREAGRALLPARAATKPEGIVPLHVTAAVVTHEFVFVGHGEPPQPSSSVSASSPSSSEAASSSAGSAA